MVKRSKLTAGQWKQRVASGGVVNEKEDVWYPSQAAKEGEGRPNMVRLYECKNVLLQGITFRNSPAWCIHPIHCEELTIHQVTVINPWYSQNGDALDVESCNRVVIYDCVFDAGDDAICIKSGKDKEGRMRGWPCQNVIARNNVVYHGHGGFVVGSEMSGGVKIFSSTTVHLSVPTWAYDSKAQEAVAALSKTFTATASICLKSQMKIFSSTFTMA